jgi:hypothetical protein
MPSGFASGRKRGNGKSEGCVHEGMDGSHQHNVSEKIKWLRTALQLALNIDDDSVKSDLIMNHIYFTALLNGAGLAAALAKGDGHERVYIVEPMADFENDPNVTNKKFPGNPTRSYRTRHPLKIIGEVSDWVKLAPEELQKWREKLANNKGEIIN